MYVHARKKPKEIVRIFSMMYKNRIPINRKDPLILYQNINFKGKSFLVNPEGLWEGLIHERPRDIAIYLALASIRSYPEYKHMGILDLDAKYCPVDDLETRMFNTDLIQNVDGRLKFLYEEQEK